MRILDVLSHEISGRNFQLLWRKKNSLQTSSNNRMSISGMCDLSQINDVHLRYRIFFLIRIDSGSTTQTYGLQWLQQFLCILWIKILGNRKPPHTKRRNTHKKHLQFPQISRNYHLYPQSPSMRRHRHNKLIKILWFHDGHLLFAKKSKPD